MAQDRTCFRADCRWYGEDGTCLNADASLPAREARIAECPSCFEPRRA
ncbi:MAG: hypothetical protein H5U03_08040 [Clostridia bacterium]|nr:hypothetical protein [Clostridia bacterium]